eukprot:jgi/Mesen1/9415/ME000614S08671
MIPGLRVLQARRQVAALGAVVVVEAIVEVSGLEVSHVSAIATHRDAGLPPPDNLSAVLSLTGGASGVLVVCYAASTSKMSWRVVCTDGTVEVSRVFHQGQVCYQLTVTPRGGGPPQESYHALSGIDDELAAFVQDVLAANSEGSAGDVDGRSQPEEALRDLAVIETALASSANGSGLLPVCTI